MLSSPTIMKLYALMLLLALGATSLSSAIPKREEDKKNRVLDKDLSEQDHYTDEDEDHNQEYDHEAFLGREQAKSFDELTPEESKQRLGKIFEKIDKDEDGKVTEDELKGWIKHVQTKYIKDDTERQWKEHEPDQDNTLLWESYKKRTYGSMDTEDEEGDEEEGGYSYKDMLHRDMRRWNKADGDGDGKLNQEEYAHFLHPEEAEHMKDIVVDETLEDIDKDKDGFISLEEYMGDLYPDSEHAEGEDEPGWVASEREQFRQLDKNQDIVMDREEIFNWLIPEDWDHVKVETEHLLQQADENKDGYLTKEEVLDKYDLFVGSQATDFGEALTRHDEF